MAEMQDYYVEAIDALYAAIIAEPMLDPSQTDNVKYVRNVYKSDWIPKSGLPSIHCFIPSKTIEEHLQIGYQPFTTMQGRVTLRCTAPGDYTSALLSAMDLTSIVSNDNLWRAMYYITNVIEYVLRRSANYRLSNFGSNDVMIVRPTGSYFNSLQLDNTVMAVANVNVMFQQRILDV